MARTTSGFASWTIAACLIALFAVTFAYAPARLDATDDQSQVMSWAGAQTWAKLNCQEHGNTQQIIVRLHADDLLTVAAFFDDIQNRNGLAAACTAALATAPRDHNALISASTAEPRHSAVLADIQRSY